LLPNKATQQSSGYTGSQEDRKCKWHLQSSRCSSRGYAATPQHGGPAGSSSPPDGRLQWCSPRPSRNDQERHANFSPLLAFAKVQSHKSRATARGSHDLH
jgi:hypothetical protein